MNTVIKPEPTVLLSVLVASMAIGLVVIGVFAVMAMGKKSDRLPIIGLGLAGVVLMVSLFGFGNLGIGNAVIVMVAVAAIVTVTALFTKNSRAVVGIVTAVALVMGTLVLVKSFRSTPIDFEPEEVPAQHASGDDYSFPTTWGPSRRTSISTAGFLLVLVGLYASVNAISRSVSAKPSSET